MVQTGGMADRMDRADPCRCRPRAFLTPRFRGGGQAAGAPSHVHIATGESWLPLSWFTPRQVVDHPPQAKSVNDFSVGDPTLRVSALSFSLRSQSRRSERPSEDLNQAPQTKKSQQTSPALFVCVRYFVTPLRHYFSSSAVTALRIAHAAGRHVVLDSPQALAKPFG